MSNVFSFTGTVGRDAEVRSAPSGVAILNVTVANNIGFGDKQQTIWVRVVLFGKRAEGNLQNYLKKGQQVFVSGELTQSEYKASDGTTKTSLELNATVIDLIGKRADQDAPQKAQQRPASKPANDLPYDDFDDSIQF
jgi:single-strand DNA-binding protein